MPMMVGGSVAVRFLQVVCLMCGSASQSTPGREIRSISLSADLPRYSGPCPVMVHFKARVRLARTPMLLQYFWEHAEAEGKPETETVSLPRGMDAQFEVRDSWAVGGAGEAFRVTDRLHVSTGDETLVSETAEFTVHCDP